MTTYLSEIVAEMRAWSAGRGNGPPPCVTDWADRLQSLATPSPSALRVAQEAVGMLVVGMEQYAIERRPDGKWWFAHDQTASKSCTCAATPGAACSECPGPEAQADSDDATLIAEWSRQNAEYNANPHPDDKPAVGESTRELGDLLPAVARHLLALDSDNWMLAQEVQRAATRAEGTVDVPRWVLDYARSLATSMHGTFYRKDAPNWQAFDDLPGLLSQIDNMYAGLRSRINELDTLAPAALSPTGCAATLPIVEAISDERVKYKLIVGEQEYPMVLMFAANGTDHVNVLLEARHCDGADNCEPIALALSPQGVVIDDAMVDRACIAFTNRIGTNPTIQRQADAIRAALAAAMGGQS